MFPEENCRLASSLQDFFYAIFPTEDESPFHKDDPFILESSSAKDCGSTKGDISHNTFWFRGVSDSLYKSRPSLYRNIKKDEHKKTSTCDEFWKDLQSKESMIRDEFLVRNYHLLSGYQPEKNNYLVYSIMQHNGVSTRLLDWSEEALTGLYFALENYFDHEKEDMRNTVPCVWVLKPLVMQHWALKQFFLLEKSAKRYKISSDLESERIETVFTINKNKLIEKLYDRIPAPILCPYNSERIRAQSGAFTIFPLVNNWCKSTHPKWDLSIEDLPEAENFLLKIVITSPKEISNQLKEIGIKTSHFFPEIPKVSIEIEEKFVRKNYY